MSIDTGVLLMGDSPVKELVEWAKRLEEWGYDTLWLADERFFREVYSSLTICALNTQSLKMGTCVTDPFSRHPALTAMAIATVDDVSDGRAILGLGAGIAGFHELGIRSVRPAKALREAVGLVRALIQHKEVEFFGQTTKLERAQLNFEPYRKDLPVFIASNSPYGLRAAGEIADGVIVSSCGDGASLKSTLSMVARGAQESGRSISDLKVVARLNCCVSDDEEKARDAVRLSVVRTFLTYPGSLSVAGLGIPDTLITEIKSTGYTHSVETLMRLAAKIPDSVIDASTLAGTVEGVADKLVGLIKAGMDELIIRPSPVEGTGIEETLRRFATEVMPKLKEKVSGRDIGGP